MSNEEQVDQFRDEFIEWLEDQPTIAPSTIDAIVDFIDGIDEGLGEDVGSIWAEDPSRAGIILDQLNLDDDVDDDIKELYELAVLELDYFRKDYIKAIYEECVEDEPKYETSLSEDFVAYNQGKLAVEAVMKRLLMEAVYVESGTSYTDKGVKILEQLEKDGKTLEDLSDDERDEFFNEISLVPLVDELEDETKILSVIVDFPEGEDPVDDDDENAETINDWRPFIEMLRYFQEHIDEIDSLVVQSASLDDEDAAFVVNREDLEPFFDMEMEQIDEMIKALVEDEEE